MKVIGAFATLVATLAITSVHASEQTIESAQAFLGQTLRGGGVKFEIDIGNGWNVFPADKVYCKFIPMNAYAGIRQETRCGDSSRTTTSLAPYQATGSLPDGSCATVVHARTKSTKEFERDAMHRNTYHRITPYPQQPPFRIDWANVQEVKQELNRVVVLGPKPVRFEVSSEQFAVRVAYAMDFLRVGCDVGSGTGF